MKKLRVLAKVYDTNSMEFVQRYAEIPVSDEIILGLQKSINPEGLSHSPIHAVGHGDSENALCLKSPLRNQRRFHVDPQLILIDVDEVTGVENVIGGWQGM